MFIGEGEYSLDAFTEIKVTESYLQLDQNIRNCQNDEEYSNCTTRKHLDTTLDQCGCLPLNIKVSDKVIPRFIIRRD